MARAAFRHAASLTTFGTDIVGIGATCALATDREKRGQHKAFVSTYSCSGESAVGEGMGQVTAGTRAPGDAVQKGAPQGWRT